MIYELPGAGISISSVFHSLELYKNCGKAAKTYTEEYLRASNYQLPNKFDDDLFKLFNVGYSILLCNQKFTYLNYTYMHESRHNHFKIITYIHNPNFINGENLRYYDGNDDLCTRECPQINCLFSEVRKCKQTNHIESCSTETKINPIRRTFRQKISKADSLLQHNITKTMISRKMFVSL